MADDWKLQIDRIHQGLVRRDDPTAWVTEADAVDASYRYPDVALRGPVFGIAVRDPRVDAGWRLLKPVTGGTPQEARDGLHSWLWFRAKDEADGREERRELLAAVSVLERERADELEVRGARYRVVRGDEFTRSGADGPEPPRPTDPEPVERNWEGREDAPSRDLCFVLDPDREEGLMAGALRVALRGFAYAGSRFPPEVREDSRRAAVRYPEVVLLPVGFAVLERGAGGWRPRGAMMPSPHAARRLLYGGMTGTWPMVYGFDARERARYARAAEEFRAAGRADEVRVGDSLFRICRIDRMVRYSTSEGPEGPRPSDVEYQEPMRMHPAMDEDGTVHHGA